MAIATSRTAVRITRLAATCNAIGNELADEAGFVSVRALLFRFQAELVIRPLLVEAMIANVEAAAPDATAKARWAVLVDSERYSVTADAIRDESHEHPLPMRFRTTIAHELAHSLAFRPSEFGIEPLLMPETKSSQQDLVAAVERETDRMAPLLLLPEKILRKLLSGKKTPFTAADLQSVCRHFGISRYVLINRLMLLLRRDEQSGLRESAALRNVGIGIGTWTRQGEAVLRKWPLYINFDNGIVPTPLLKLANQDRLPAKTLVRDDGFVLCGGRSEATELTWDAGLQGSKADEIMQVLFSVEATGNRPESDFLFVISKSSDGSTVACRQGVA